MRYRWLSTFTVIGVLLIVLGIVGLADHKFVYDPGQTFDSNEPWYYLVVGLLMIVNGLLTPAVATTDQKKTETEKSETGTSESETPGDKTKRRSHRVAASAEKRVNE